MDTAESPRLCTIYLRDVLSLFPREDIDADFCLVSRHTDSVVSHCPGNRMPRRTFHTLGLIGETEFGEFLRTIPRELLVRSTDVYRQFLDDGCCEELKVSFNEYRKLQPSHTPSIQEPASGLVGESVCTDDKGGSNMLWLFGDSRRYGPKAHILPVAWNRLSNEKTAFVLLHFLSHLNGAVFESVRGMDRLNPAILQVLENHHRAMGSTYRLPIAIEGR